MSDERISSRRPRGWMLPVSASRVAIYEIPRPSESRPAANPAVCLQRAGLYIQELHIASVLFDELAARLDLIAHQHREELVRRGGVVDRDLLKRARGRVHRRHSKLVGVHLSEPLEALELNAVLRELHHAPAKPLEGQSLRVVLVELELERRRTHELEKLLVDTRELAVLVRSEQLA